MHIHRHSHSITTRIDHRAGSYQLQSTCKSGVVIRMRKGVTHARTQYSRMCKNGKREDRYVEEACPAGLHHSGFSCGNHQPKIFFEIPNVSAACCCIHQRLVVQRKSLFGDFRKRTLRRQICQDTYIIRCWFSDVIVE